MAKKIKQDTVQEVDSSDTSEAQNQIEVTGSRRWMIFLVALLMMALIGMGVYTGYLEQQSFLHTQNEVSERSVNRARSRINTLLASQRLAMRLFAISQANTLKNIAGESPYIVDMQALTVSLQRELPSIISLAVFNSKTNFLRSAVPRLVTTACRRRFAGYLSGDAQTLIAFHGEGADLHYDLIVPLAEGNDVLLAVSFGLQPVLNVLQAVQAENHHLQLLQEGTHVTKRYLSGLARNASVDSQATKAGYPVAGSAWWLFDVPLEQAQVDHLMRIIWHRLVLLSLFLLILLVIFRTFHKREKALVTFKDKLLGNTAELQYQSLHDYLTGLPNRALFEERIQAKISEVGRSGNRFVIILVSLNDFRRINKNLGYDIGDQVLWRVGDRLSSALREVDSVSRFEGDVFAVLADVADESQAALIAVKILDCLHDPIDVGRSPVLLTASIGAAIFPTHGRDRENLVKYADQAVSIARSSEGSGLVFAAKVVGDQADRLSLVTEIPDAMNNGELSMVYQPKLTLIEPKKQTFEALLRWDHSEHGALSAEIFIPLVEQTRHIIDLTQWTVKQCFNTLRSMNIKTGYPVVAINLSARVLEDEGFPLWVERTMAEFGLTAESIRFELTESAMMADSERAMQAMLRLAALGVGLSVDDFGVGHSSLAYISRLPVDELKVDKSFVSNMLKWESDRAIVKSTIDLAHDLGLSVVAEGVETLEQATMLREMECDALQGYYISKPLTEDQLLSWIASSAG